VKLHPDSPCEAIVAPLEDGGIDVKVRVPTYSGGMELTLKAERSNDGDWVLFLPMWPEGMDEAPVTAVDWLGNDYDVGGGIVYVGAPDIPVKATWGRA
jgi:hypothetical protein